MDTKEFDHHSKEMAYDPWPKWRELRAGPPLAHSDKHGGFHIASRYEEVCEVTRNTDVFSSEINQIPAIQAPKRPPINVDPPEHQNYRVILNSFLTPAKVKVMEPWIREMVLGYVTPALASSAFNVPKDIGVPLMRDVTMRMMGIVDVPAEVNHWADDLIFNRNAAVAAKNLLEFLGSELDKRAVTPGTDIMTAIAQANYVDRPLSRAEQTSMALLVLLAGLDTTNFAIAGAAWYLIQHPQARQDLAAATEGTWRLAMDEFVRWVTPAQGIARVATSDTSVGGCPMHKGEMVLMLFGSANRDEKEFPNPDDVVLDRFPNRHLGFGMGPHRCIGSHLAKAVMQITLRELLTGLDNFQLADPGAVEWDSAGVRGIRSLPLMRV